MIIGITGGSGCGKTTLLSVIEEYGGVVLDCDEIYHRLLETDASLLEQINTRFPNTVKDGALQRKELGNRVFSNPEALKALNEITHNAVKQQVMQLLTPPPELAAIDAIALAESGLNQLCHITVAVTAPESTRVARIMARDCISRDYALARIHAQPSNEAFSEQCDYTLENNGSQEAFRSKCLAFLRQLAII